MNKRIKKIRDEFFRLDAKVQEAFESGDMPEFEKQHGVYFEFICKYQKELNIPDEQIESMREELAKLSKTKAEIEYLEAKTARLKREAAEIKQKIEKDLENEIKSGRIKWQ